MKNCRHVVTRNCNSSAYFVHCAILDREPALIGRFVIDTSIISTITSISTDNQAANPAKFSSANLDLYSSARHSALMTIRQQILPDAMNST